jgi:7-cyano-7-deazaguanine synthase in queuosine biosynthesis
MATFCDWFVSNILSRSENTHSDLDIQIKPYLFSDMSFHESADYTARLISNSYRKIYISLSGGADSEYVVRSFHRNSLPFDVIIIKTEGNAKELYYAHKLCSELNIVPIVLDLDNKTYLKEYMNVVKEISGYGIYSIPTIFSTRYAMQNDGVCIIGEHVLDTDKTNDNIILGVNEWDFYGEYFVGEKHIIPFFLYTQELCYSMIQRIVKDEPLKLFKSRLYGIEEREIFQYEFSDMFKRVSKKISQSRKNTNQKNHVLLDNLSILLEKSCISNT